ncbi:hypothetical protein CEY16_11305 [Halalkalibacillus sediminis]|uniref:Uncharacterized protein n=1 Tax=Halalkalibacillus sediminis TaxID=2018042 RepID=A0A2I0QSN3_9BACI|nr:hypothetical protein [Halalkalibacillus sediminis]PKR77314.1 hypothetical protein CEY16_11305 [Halalkalibacillus sediminis]
MKNKDFVLSITLYAFLGYLWLLFIDHIGEIANTMDNVLIFGGIIILLGTVLFGEIVRRVTPFNEYKNSHPVKIAGFVSFGLVVVASLFV